MSRSFRLQRGSSIKLGRSNNSILVSESISSECAAITGYERLSQSMRFPNKVSAVITSHDKLSQSMRLPTTTDSTTSQFGKKKDSWLVRNLSRTFSRKRREVGGCKEGKRDEVKKKNGWSSWLPDPNRRWPVQGW